jgi:RNA polymerase sigma-70 factor, ECF subfamily
VQEAFLRVHRHLPRFDQARKFSTWIYTIASNLAKNEIRNRRRSLVVLFQAFGGGDERSCLPFEDPAPASRPDVALARRHLRQLVDSTLRQLIPAHREVFVPREIEGRSYAEIARRTGCNLGTVKSRLNRARRSFAELIAPHLD